MTTLTMRKVGIVGFGLRVSLPFPFFWVGKRTKQQL